MIKTTAKRIAAVTLSLSLLFQATPSFAAPTYDEQIETLESKIRQYDNKIIESMTKVEALNKEMSEAKVRVEETKAEIASLEESYNRTLELSKDRIANIQLNGSAHFNFFEVILSSEGISDFVQKTTALVTIMASDRQLTETLVEKQEDLEEKKAELEADLTLIQTNQAAAEAERAAIQEDKASVEAELKNVEEAKQRAELERQQEEARLAALASQQQESTQEPSSSTTSATTEASSSNTNSSQTSTTVKPSTTTTSTSASASAVIAEAKKYLGVPYVWGGTSPSGFDCSGFTSYVYKKVGISLPRTSRAQQNIGKQVSLSNVQPGDLVFMGKPAYHVGIYIGGGKYIHAPQTGDVVKIASFNPSKFSSATRVLK